MRLSKMDELDALIAGVLFVDSMNAQECYYWAPPVELPVHTHSSDTVTTNIHVSRNIRIGATLNCHMVVIFFGSFCMGWDGIGIWVDR